MRGEAQKPVTDAYRDGWDRIFVRMPRVVEQTFCMECMGNGTLLEDHDGLAGYRRCEYCGGIGFVEPDSGPASCTAVTE